MRAAYGDRVPGGGGRWLDEHRPGWRGCLVEGCEKRARSRGWCGAHYERWRRWGDPTYYPPPPVKPAPPSREEIAAEMREKLAQAREVIG